MAVRRRLLQEPLVGGVIAAERPPPAPPAPPAPPPPSSDPSPGEAPLRRRGLRPEDCAVFQCRGCRAVLGDSLHLCAQEERRLGLLACLRVTGDVAWEDALLVGLEGALLGCAYNALYCRSCGAMVGFILYSAFSNLAHLRGLFCFFKESILCYLLKNNITIEASKVNFPALTLKEQLGKLKEKLVMVHMRLELLIKKMEELKQKDMAQNYGSASDAVALMPGYAILNTKNNKPF